MKFFPTIRNPRAPHSVSAGKSLHAYLFGSDLSAEIAAWEAEAEPSNELYNKIWNSVIDEAIQAVERTELADFKLQVKEGKYAV